MTAIARIVTHGQCTPLWSAQTEADVLFAHSAGSARLSASKLNRGQRTGRNPVWLSEQRMANACFVFVAGH